MDMVKKGISLVMKLIHLALFLVLLYYAVFCMPSLAGWCLLLAAVLVAPVNRLQNMLDKMLLRKWLKRLVIGVAVVALVVTALMNIVSMQTAYETTGQLNRVWGYYIAYYLAKLRNLIF